MSELRYDIPAIRERPAILESALELHDMSNALLADTAVDLLTEVGLYGALAKKDVADVQAVSRTALQSLMDVDGRITRGQVGHGVERVSARLIADAYITTAAKALRLVCINDAVTLQPPKPSKITPERLAQDMGVVVGVTRRAIASSQIGNVQIREVPNSERVIGGPGTLKQLLKMGPPVRRRYTPIQVTTIEILARAGGPNRRLVAKEVKHG